MQSKYIGILVCKSLKQDKCPLMNDADIKYLTDNGYFDEKGNMTKKASDFLNYIEDCGMTFEGSYAFKQEAKTVLNDAKKTFDNAFNSFRNSASDLFQSMADTMKVKQ